MEDTRRHEAALRAVQKPPAKPWRGTGTGKGAAVLPPPPPPPKVYRVEAREFRDLVQKLTGAAPITHHHPTTPAEDHHHQQQQLYAPSSWFSFPNHGNGALM